MACAAVVLLASCSSSPGKPAAEEKATPTAPAPSVEPDRLAALQTARVDLSAEPDWLVTGFGSLWTKRSDGSVVRISPRGKVLAIVEAKRFELPVCQGLGVSADAIWACATHGTINRIDPETNAIAASIKIPKINDQGRLVSSGDRVWVLTGDGDRLTPIVESTNRPGPPIDLGHYCSDTADEAVGGVLWVVCASDGVLLRVDLQRGKVTGTVDGLPLATSVSAGDDVWVGFEQGLARVDPRTLDVTMLQAAVTPDRVRAVGDHVWVREEGGEAFLSRVDAATGEVRQVIAAPGLTSGGDVIELGAVVWASSYDDLTLVRLAP